MPSGEQVAASTDGVGHALLAKSVDTLTRRSEAGSTSWSRSSGLEGSSFSYSEWSARARSSTYHVDQWMRIEVIFALPLDPVVCGEVKVDPTGTPKRPRPRYEAPPKGGLG